MPALPAAPKTIRVALQGLVGGATEWVTRQYVSYTGSSPDSAELDTYCESMMTLFASDVAPWMCQSDEIDVIAAVDLNSNTGAEGSFEDSVNGSMTGQNLPGDTAMVVSYEISRRYRGGHARGYWRVGDDTAISTPQSWDPTFLSNAGGGITTFLAGLTSAPWSGAGTLTQVNVSYYEGFTVHINSITGRARNVPTLRDTPLINAVSSYIPRAPIGSQRRRQR